MRFQVVRSRRSAASGRRPAGSASAPRRRLRGAGPGGRPAPAARRPHGPRQAQAELGCCVRCACNPTLPYPGRRGGGCAAQGKNVLRKEPMGRDIADDDVFFYNGAFTSKFYKVKVGTVSAQKETEPEKADTRHKARAHGPPRRTRARARGPTLPGALELGLPSRLDAACALPRLQTCRHCQWADWLPTSAPPAATASHASPAWPPGGARRVVHAGWGREVYGRVWRAR